VFSIGLVFALLDEPISSETVLTTLPSRLLRLSTTGVRDYPERRLHMLSMKTLAFSQPRLPKRCIKPFG
jgi:hypothetical protein